MAFSKVSVALAGLRMVFGLNMLPAEQSIAPHGEKADQIQLVRAVRTCSKDTIDLLDKNVDPDFLFEYEQSGAHEYLLNIALRSKCDVAIITALLEHGAKLDKKVDRQPSALQAALSATGPHQLEVVKALLKAGANVNEPSKFLTGGFSWPGSLMTAIHFKCGPEVIGALLDAKADDKARGCVAIDSKTCYWMTPLDAATEGWSNSGEKSADRDLYASIIKLLFKAGAPISKTLFDKREWMQEADLKKLFQDALAEAGCALQHFLDTGKVHVYRCIRQQSVGKFFDEGRINVQERFATLTNYEGFDAQLRFATELD